nr:hypothetical protein [Tanacetum cinerariifolium]
MFGVPPIPPPIGTNTGNVSNHNRVDTMPIDNINNVTTTNVAQNVVNEDLPQLLDSRGAYEGPSDTRDTKIATLRLKFNDFKALEGEKVQGTYTWLKLLLNDLENKGVYIPQAEESDSDVEEDTRSNNEFLADLNVEFHDRALLANQKRFYKRSGRVGSAKKTIDKSKETCFACGVVAESFDWDEESVPLRMKGLPGSRNIVRALGGRGKKKEHIPSKDVLFTKANESPTKTTLEITSDSESECDNQEHLPPLPKILGAEPTGTSTDVLTMADLTQTSAVFEEIKKVHKKEKKADSSTKQLLLTLMKEVKGLKEKIKIPSDTSPYVSQLGCSKSAKGKQKI